MIKLDEFESAIIHYSKGWYNSTKESFEKDMITFWGNRCGISYKYVQPEYILFFVIELMEKLNLNNKSNIIEIVMASVYPERLRYDEYIKHQPRPFGLIRYIIIHYFSGVQILEGKEVLVSLSEWDESFFQADKDLSRATENF